DKPPAAPSAPAAPAAPRSPAPPGPGGMVYVEVAAGQEPKTGTTPADILKLVANRKEVMLQFTYETPQHKVALKPFFMDATEITNAQYSKFLEAAARTTYKTGSSALANLLEIGSFFVFGDAKKAEQKETLDDRTWAQLYEINKVGLEAAMPDLKGQKAKWKFAALPPDFELVVYRRLLPGYW